MPSGKFDTNDLVLTLGALTYNIEALYRLDGFNRPSLADSASSQEMAAPNGDQELMYLAARVIESGRRLKLQFSRYCPGFEAFQYVYQKLAYG